MPIQIGQKAPSFKMIDTDRQETTLEQYAGKNLVMLFFPFAFTGTCTKELCMMRDSIAEYNNLHADVLAVSVDSIHSLKKYKEEQQLNFRLASDFNKTVSTDFDTIYEIYGLGFHGVSKRSAFVIDKDGIIRYAEVLENAGEIPDFEKVKRLLAELE